MKFINSLEISQENIPINGGKRSITVTGDGGASFVMQVFTSGNKFYNFNTQSFDSAFSSRCAEIVTLSGSSEGGATFKTSITFPVVSSDTSYFVLLAANDNENEVFFRVSDLNVENKAVIRKIDQIGTNATVTFQPASANTDTYTSGSLDGTVKKQSTGNQSSSSTIEDLGTLTVTNTSSDAQGFGLRVTSTPSEFHWYFEATETVNGTTSSSTSVVVDDLTDLVVGMEMTYKTGTTAAAAGTRITAIDTSTKTLTLSVANSLTDGNTMTFRAYGPTLIQKATGLSFSTSTALATTVFDVETTARGATSASTTLNITDTYGIAGGNHVTYKGANVNNSEANAVTSISQADAGGGDANGTLVVQLAQTLKGGETLTFRGSSKTVNITGSVNITSYPTSNRTIYLDLDKFITPGAAS